LRSPPIVSRESRHLLSSTPFRSSSGGCRTKKSECKIMVSKRSKANDEAGYRHWKPARGPFIMRLLEDPTLPTLQDDVVCTAAEHLKIVDDKKRTILREQLRQIVRDYWELRRDIVERPPQRWYRDNIKAVGKAANNLLILLQDCSGTALMRLEREVSRSLNMELRQRSSPSSQKQSIKNIVEGLKVICDRLVFVEKPGAIVGKSGAIDMRATLSCRGRRLKISTNS
jgi:hypothetical protein